MKYYFLALGTALFVCIGCAYDGQHFEEHGLAKGVHHAPPAAMMQRPGPMVDGPGPGVLPMMAAPSAGRSFATRTTQVRFVGPDGTQVGWKIPGGYAENQVVAPGRYNFRQGATYRLKMKNIAGRDGMTIYPTLQVYPSHPTTDAYLAHNSVPIELTDEDLDQVESNNFVTKVIYLPDARFQELAIAGVETLVSTRLDPGVDPVAEAERRGTIMVVVRLGNMDLEMPEKSGGHGALGDHSEVNQVSYRVLDGAQGQHMPPMPISISPGGLNGVPAPMIVAGAGAPGMPASNPISGVGPTPVWGQPITGTPIGLPGPAHIPLGGPASLKSHTVRNLTDTRIPKPVDHMLVDVKHEPGYSVPKPVKHIQYTEKHPVYSEGEVAYPKWALPEGPAAGADGAYCPPGQQ
ncbi:MAG: hypothetical protein AB7O26_04860 [Planctomycetaceae bacterium]